MAAAAPAPHERAYGVTNIKNHIPVILDIDDGNYDAWRELIQTHCQSFDVSGHLDGTLLPANDNDNAWTKRDGLVKLWLYGTLSKELFKSTFKTGGTAREIWIRLENFFRDNKEARAIQLDHKLRNKEIGDLTIHSYCQELKSIADLLSNVDAPVSERTLVTYLLNGLNDKYDNIINVIMHRRPFPTFEEARSMLLLEEERLGKGKKPTPSNNDSASSAKVLIATESDSDQKQQQSKNHQQQRFNQNRGHRGRGGNRGRGRNNNQQRSGFNQWNAPYWQSGYPMWPQQQFNPWTQLPFQQQGLLGPRPQQKQQAQNGGNKFEPTMDFAQAFNTLSLMDPSDNNWYMDSGATAHLSNTTGNLKSVFKNGIGKMVTVANGGKIPITTSGYHSFPTKTRPLSLNSVLVTPSIIKNLISVRRFTKDNSCSVEFDPLGFSVKDLHTKKTILRSNSTGDLYPVLSSSNNEAPVSAFNASITDWHRRLAHPSDQTLKYLLSSNAFSCNNRDIYHICSSCQFGKQIKLPFAHSNTIVDHPFDIIHSDLWTSPVQSVSGIKYYVLFLDHHSHFLWVYPMRYKHETFSKYLHSAYYVKTQFGKEIKALQCDNGGEFNNSQFHAYFADKGTTFRFSCPHTSQQNGKSERMIRTINNAMRSHLPSSFWVEALHTAVHILNLLLSKVIQNRVPFLVLFKKPISYSH